MLLQDRLELGLRQFEAALHGEAQPLGCGLYQHEDSECWFEAIGWLGH